MHTRGRWFAIPALVCIVAYSFVAGAASKRKILTTLFDGVPTPEQREAKKQAKKKPAKRAESAPESPDIVAVPAVSQPEKQRPPIENLKTWEEVLKSLPRDAMGGADWVKAVKEAVIAPRPLLPSDSQPAAPFTLDNLVPGTVSDTSPAFDLNIEFVPRQASFYKVVFPHSGHTMWLNCSSCHPGIVAQRGTGMQKIFAGEYCGRCHGKVSFSPLGSCARCHGNLTPAAPEAIEADLARAAKEAVSVSAASLERGKSLYQEACAVCHGENGDGNGPLAAGLNPKPRNFTSGKFKFRSTSSSSLPTDVDLFRTITRGIQGTSMPGFSSLRYEDRFAILQFIKTFSDRFAKQKAATPINLPDPPPLTPELLETGKKFFNEAECFKCHGREGRGDGPSSVGMKDDWGESLRPFDFTSGRPKSGSSLKDYYRDVMTGLQGTPMPDFGDVFEPEQAWAVIYYVYSLGNAKRDLPPNAVKGDIVFTRNTAAPDQRHAELTSLVPVVPRESSTQTAPDNGENLPPATFPHWFHRVRVRCAVCHSGIFEMKAGANAVSMDAIRAGKFCGKCHPSYPDSKTLAWPVTFESCGRCHVAR
jgi:c(7)-type cytochrome triheme protein